MIPLRDDNPSSIPPTVTVIFIIACCVVFLFQVSQPPVGFKTLVYGLGVIPAVLFQHAQLPDEIVMVPAMVSVVTSMFLHGGWMHLISNMLYLWIFGDNVEDSMGHVRFVAFYLLCGVAAVFAQALPNPTSEIPMIGASGAISGVLGAYIILFPHARVLVAIPIGFYVHMMRMPAGAVLGIWFVMQLISSLAASGAGGGVAFRAHLGGFFAGIILIPFFKYSRFRLRSPVGRVS